MKKKNKGFTLVELIIVIAIMIVLVAVLAPVFTPYVEKSRRAADVQTAKSIESALMAAATDGSIQVPKTNNNQPRGAWVLICRDKDSLPTDYSQSQFKNGTFFCGVDPKVSVNGVTSNGPWNRYNDPLAKVLAEVGITPESATLRCKKADANEGWDWIVVEVGYANGKYSTRMYSGLKGQSSENVKVANSNLEKTIEKQ